MSGSASSSAVAVPQVVQTSTWPGNNYPEMITKAIQESANGRLTVKDLYRILPQYDSTIISKLIEKVRIENIKKQKPKTPTEVFQDNVRQNLCRKKDGKERFRKAIDPNTGKCTGYWELVESESRFVSHYFLQNFALNTNRFSS
jgi:hypothetical protein